MIEQPEPTRAEATDIANAILDGTSALMLSGETTVGRYPVEAVEAMAEIAVEAERGCPLSLTLVSRLQPGRGGDAVGGPPRPAGGRRRDRRLHRQRWGGARRGEVPAAPPVVALSEDERVRRQLALEWGVVLGMAPAPGAGARGAPPR